MCFQPHRRLVPHRAPAVVKTLAKPPAEDDHASLERGSHPGCPANGARILREKRNRCGICGGGAPGAVLVLAAALGGCASASHENTDVLLRLGDRMQAQGAPEAALHAYRQAAETRPDSAEARIGEAESLASLGNFGAAIDAYGAALHLAPENPAALSGLIRVLIRSGQPKLAFEPLDRLKQVTGDDARTCRLAGAVLDLAGDHAAAQQRYRAALARQPDDKALSANLALSLALSGDFRAAIAVLKPLAERADATARLRQTLALVHGLAGDFADAHRLGLLDLDEAAVRHNLDLYRKLRALPPAARTNALLVDPAVLPR